MRKLLAVALALASASYAITAVAYAGVVLTEKETVSGAGPQARVTERTVSIQGAKEKMSGEDRDMIIDLDKGVLYMVIPSHKVYMEMPFPPPGMMSRMASGPAFSVGDFKSTGKSQTVAGFKCDEYTGTGKSMMGEFMMNSCFSKAPPSASDYSNFMKKMMAKLKDASQSVPSSFPDGVLLSQTTTTSMKTVSMPNMPPEMQQRLANHPPIVRTTEVTKLEAKDLPDSAFAPPAGFTKQEMPAGHGMGGPAAGGPPPMSGGMSTMGGGAPSEPPAGNPGLTPPMPSH